MVEGWVVSNREAGLALGEFLRQRLGQAAPSKRQIKRWIEQKRCVVNGQTETFASSALLEGDRVTLSIPQEREGWQLIDQRPEGILVIRKPSGIVVDHGEGLHLLLQREFGDVRVVHRLDKETSGVMLFACNAEQQERLEEAFRRRDIDKEYVAVVWGSPEKERGMIDSPVGGKSAKTSWEVRKRGRERSLLLLRPTTGRTHQLRVHLAKIGLPIVGDHLYGTREAVQGVHRILLHASGIAWKGEWEYRDREDPILFSP